MKTALKWTLGIALAAALGLIALSFGAAGGRLDKPWIAPLGDWVITTFTTRKQADDAGFRDTSGRTKLDCARFAPDPRTAVIVTLGQSNAANQSRGFREGSEGTANFNWFDGRCYTARDPLLGSDGVLASPWTRLANRLVSEGVYDRVLIVPLAVSGTTVSDWAPGGRLNFRIETAATALREVGIAPTHILWHQGESDAGKTDPGAYVADFTAMVEGMRALGWDAPVYTARATLCLGETDPALNAAQASLPSTIPGVFAGPDTDTLDSFSDRHDRCHFTETGTDAHADLWFEVLTGDQP